MRRKTGRKIIVLGLDGATLDLIEQWKDAQHLPFFTELIQKGCWGKMESTNPPITFPAIPSMLTGKNPGKHGICNFIRPKKDGSLGLVSSNDLDGEFFSFPIGKKIIVNVPLTYPAKNIDGAIVIAGLLSPSINADNFIHPPELKMEIKKLMRDTNYRIDIDQPMPFWDSIRKQRYLNELVEIAKSRTFLACRLANKYPWDLLMVYYTIIDRASHCSYRKEYLLKAYQAVEKCIKHLVETLKEPDAVLLLFSDHGFGPSKGRFYPNRWLYKQGYLKYLKDKEAKTNVFDFFKHRLPEMGRAMERISAIFPFNRSSSVFNKILNFLDKAGGSYDFTSIDWKTTKAYATISGIYIVNKEKHRTKKKIKRELSNLQLKGRNLTVRIWERHELFNGYRVSQLPDIIYSVEGYAYEPFPGLGRGNAIVQFGSVNKGWHRREAMFIVKGRGVKEGKKINGVKIYDLAPTILHLIKHRIPLDVDGRVIKNLRANGQAT